MVPPCPSSSCFCSVCGRPAFMGKSVFGKFSVFFSSSGSAMIGALVHPFHAVLVYRYTAGNNGKQCKQYVTMNVSRCQPLGACNLSRPLRIISARYTELGECTSN